MRLWTSRCRTDRNKPSRLKIDFGKSGYNGFFLTDITDFSFFDRFITDFWVTTDAGSYAVSVATLWGHENELSTKFWGSWKAYFCCSSFITVFSYFVPAKTRLGRPPKKHMKKKYENFVNMYSNCFNTIKAFVMSKS